MPPLRSGVKKSNAPSLIGRHEVDLVALGKSLSVNIALPAGSEYLSSDQLIDYGNSGVKITEQSNIKSSIDVR